MELVDLSFIIAVARKEEKMHGRQMCVALNRKTYDKLRNDLRHAAYVTPAGSWHTFEYYGHVVSWTPALDNFPDGYAIGAVWPGGA